jgi:hypothetical protein
MFWVYLENISQGGYMQLYWNIQDTKEFISPYKAKILNSSECM